MNSAPSLCVQRNQYVKMEALDNGIILTCVWKYTIVWRLNPDDWEEETLEPQEEEGEEITDDLEDIEQIK